MVRITILLTFIVILGTGLQAQNIEGKVTDSKTGEPVIGANVVLKGTSIGVSTDFEGNFVLNPGDNQPPYILLISFIGYQNLEFPVPDLSKKIVVKLSEDSEMLSEVNVIEQRLSDKQKESALTVEAMDVLAIKETPAASFYDGLGNLKGVDLTSASIGFKIINTRGFNSTSPVRSLQLIDGVDNQAPGLNFSLGNFLGASELDILNVDIIAGASSAFYGPGAFNGVIAMTTKNPFKYQGISASVKVGERAFTETAVRYAEAFKLGKKDYENFAFKVNIYYLTANDWEATNYDPVDDSEVPATNPGRYDAVNIYGDEALVGGNNFDNVNSVLDFPSYAGLGIFYRPGYKEEDIVDYDTRNLKTNLGLYYKLNPEVELSYNVNFGYGTTVYQGENRFSLKDITFLQNEVQLMKEDKFFVRAYSTHENAGNSYDAVVTAFKINDAIAPAGEWNNAYKTLWRRNPPQGFGYGEKTLDLTGRYTGNDAQGWFEGAYKDSLAKYRDIITAWHDTVLSTVNEFSYPRPEPGTAAYDSLLQYFTSRTFTEGGSKFYDKSALYHFMGEYQFHPEWADIRVGGNLRLYRPDSRGNIFDEIDSIYVIRDNFGNEIDREYFYRQITNNEYGVYLGVSKKIFSEKLKLDATLRMDKNQNFDYLFSPALSAVYILNEFNTFRLSFGRAIRNPTLQDQYLRYNVGRAILLGNLNGFDSLVTLESFDFYRNQPSLDRNNLNYFNVAPIEPERVTTLEVGYRATLLKRVFLDLNAYHSWYTNFIGYQFGLDVRFDNPLAPNNITSLQAYRIAANAGDQVTTVGFSAGLNYFITDELTFSGNYTFNRLDLRGSNSTIIPAYNTPENKFNLGITGRGYKLWKNTDHKFGFAVTFKWVQGFLFEGSPQFTGMIDDYALTDAQVSYQVPLIYCTFKLGASNILNNEVYQVYGGPTVGRLAYFSILFEKF